MPPKSQFSSLRNFDGRRAVNTPTSLLACAKEGVLPESLVRSNSPAEAQRASLPPLELQKLQLFHQHREQERAKALILVKKAYTELENEAHKSIKDKSASGAESPTRKKHDLLPGPQFHQEIDDAVAADLSVAAYFYRQAKAIEAQAAAKKLLEETSATHDARIAAHAVSQQKELLLKFQKNEEHIKQVLQKQQLHTEELAAHKAERIQRLEKRAAKIAKNVEKISHDRVSKRRQSRVDTAEVECIRLKKLADLEEKLIRHQDLAKERLEKSAKEKELYDFKVSLKRQGFVEQKERVVRSRDCQKELLQQEMDKLHEDQEAADFLAETKAKKRGIIRQMLMQQRGEVDRYLNNHVGEAEVVPPGWLSQRAARYMRERETTASARKPSIIPKPPKEGSTTTAPFTPHRPNTNSKKTERSDDMRTQTRPKDQFSISSVRISPRQKFSSWMFE